MAKKDPRVDAYIAKAAPFARPILKHLRKAVHDACPKATETMKWRMPFFEYEGILANMAAFQAHCAFGLWTGSLLAERFPELGKKSGDAMGQLGRIASLDDLPKPARLTAMIRAAAELNEKGAKPPSRAKPRGTKPELAVPDDLQAAIRKDKKAKATFEGFSRSHRNEYVEWVTEAKTEATRTKRIATTVAWLAEGKSRNWKYC